MTKAQALVAFLLEDELPKPKIGRMVRVRTPQGVVNAHWNGYYDLSEYGQNIEHSIGYPGPGGFTHGFLHPGDEILDPVPSWEDWKAEQDAKKQAAAPPPKAQFTPHFTVH